MILSSDKADFALVAIENSLYGSINQVYNLLLEHDDIWINGEIYLRINHCLIGLPESKARKPLRSLFASRCPRTVRSFPRHRTHPCRAARPP